MCIISRMREKGREREREREREKREKRKREAEKQVGLLTFFSTESVDIDFVHPEYDVTGLDLQKQQTPFLWKRILQKDQLVRDDELPCTGGPLFALRHLLPPATFRQFDDENSLQPPWPVGQPNRHYVQMPPTLSSFTPLSFFFSHFLSLSSSPSLVFLMNRTYFNYFILFI